MRQRFLLGMVLVALAVAPAVAEPTWSLEANESTYSYVCNGSDWIALRGKGNTLRVSGDCSLLEINGSDNRITIESIASIKISGNNNDVRYARAPEGKKKPTIKSKGSANSVRRD